MLITLLLGCFRCDSTHYPIETKAYFHACKGYKCLPPKDNTIILNNVIYFYGRNET